MKVHILQIPPEGKYIEGEDPNTILDLHEENTKPVSPVRYALNVGLSDGGLFATGEIGADIRLQCVSCLEHFTFPAEVKDFACQVELTGSELVDLTDPVREDILLALPAHPHCDWNGEKVCPGAFHSLKETDSLEDDSAEKPDVWGPLDQLKLK